MIKKIDAKQYIITNTKDIQNHAVNFPQFPNGVVMSSNKSYALNRFLKKNIGSRLFYTPELFPYEVSSKAGGGGLRCRTNIIPCS